MIIIEREERKTWLSSLLEGDIVYNIIYDYGKISSVKQHKIKKVTTSGRIRLDNDDLLDESGHKYNDWGSSVNIIPYCEEVEIAINKIKIINLYKECKNLFGELNEKDLNYESLSKIKEILTEMKPK